MSEVPKDYVTVVTLAKRAGRPESTVHTAILTLGVNRLGRGGRGDPYKITEADAARVLEALQGTTTRVRPTHEELERLLRRVANVATDQGYTRLEIDLTASPPVVHATRTSVKELKL